MFRYFSLLVFKMAGWKVKGQLPDLNKYVIILAPHTSNWDFMIALFARSITRVNSRYMAKESLFKPPLGWLFKALGGYPVNRSKSTKLVDKVIAIFEKEDQFIVALAPEGTRKKVKEWKSGFYYIALGANVPIVMTAFDYRRKEFSISQPLYPTGDYEKDMVTVRQFYSDKKGKNG